MKAVSYSRKRRYFRIGSPGVGYFQIVDRGLFKAAPDLRFHECRMLMPDHPTYPGPISISFWRVGINMSPSIEWMKKHRNLLRRINWGSPIPEHRT